MKAEDFHDLDKLVTKSVMKEVEGREIEHDCPECGGKGYLPERLVPKLTEPVGMIKSKPICENCHGWGKITIEY